MTIQDILSAVRTLDASELRLVNNAIVQSINNKNAMIQRQAMSNLRIGSIAKFANSKTGRDVHIRVTKFNTKTVSGQAINIADGTDTIGTWRVSPNLLRVVS